MSKNLKHLIFTFAIIILLFVVLISGTSNQKTYASENVPKLEFWFEIAGKQTLEFEEFEKEINEGYNNTWDSMVDLVEIQLKARSLTGEEVRLSAIDFDINQNEFITNVDSVQSSDLVIGNPSSPDRWIVPSITGNNTKVYFTWNGPGTLDNYNEYIPVEGILVGSIKLEVESDKLPKDFFISPTIDLEGTFSDTGDLAYLDENNTQQKYYNKDFIFKPLQVGNPNSGPDASLSSLKLDGETTSYLNKLVEDLASEIEHNVTISYADSLNGKLIVDATAKKSTATITTVGEKTTYVTGDQIVITVTDDTVTKTYNIIITVTPANNNLDLTFTTNKPGSVKLQGFDGANPNEYDIIVDFNTLEIQVTPNAHELSTLSSSVLSYTVLQAGIPQSKTVTVTAENGTSKEYTVHVTREMGNSDVSFEVKINGDEITEDENTYPLTIAETEDRFSFNISGFATTTKIYYKVGKSTSSNTADYSTLPVSGSISNIQIKKDEIITYTILVVPQAGTSQLSYIEVKRAPSTNVNLSKVSINEIADGTSYTADLTPVSGTYTYTVKDNSSDRLVFMVSGINNEGQAIQIFDKNNLQVSEVTTTNLEVGDNTYKIEVTAQDGMTKGIYTLIIKKLSDEKEVVNLELRNSDNNTIIATGIGGANSFTYDPALKRYTFTIGYDQATNFDLVLTSSDKSIIYVNQSPTTTNYRPFSGMFTLKTLQNIDFSNITIRAENGTVTDAFSIRITRSAADTNNHLEDLKIGDKTVNGFLPNKGDYPVTIFDRDTTSVFIEPTLPDNSKATIAYYIGGLLVGTGSSYNVEFNSHQTVNLEVRVTSESGETFIYKVPVIAANNDSSIENVLIYNAITNEIVFNSFSASTLNYQNITLPYSVQTIKVVVTTTNAYATVMGVATNGTYVLTTTTPLNLTIFGKSEVGTESNQKYNFTIKRETPRSYKNLETLAIKYNDADGNEVTQELDVDASDNFSIRVDNYVTPIVITANILGLQGERITGAAGNTLTLTETFTVTQKDRTVSIIVTDEGGVSKTYTIQIKRANNDKTFTSVKVGEKTYGFDEFDQNLKLTLDKILYATDKLDILFNMVPESNSTIQSQSSFIGNNPSGTWYFNQQTGLITVTFQVKSEFNELSPTYTIEIYREPALSSKTLNGITISAGASTLLSETGTIADAYELRVDRTTASVIIRTTLPIADRSSVLAPYSVDANDGLNKVYTYTLPLNNATASAATIHEITLKAEDGTTKSYSITIWRRNSNISINELIIKQGESIIHEGTFETAKKFLKTFEYNVSELTFIIRPADSFSRISINNGQRLIPVDGVITTTVPLTVGTTKEINLRIESDITRDELESAYLSKTYMFTYDKNAASSVAELDFLEASIGDNDILDGITLDFVDGNEYGDYNVSRNFSSVIIQATAKDGGTITGIGSRVLLVGRNQFLITVTSQSGTVSKDYVLIIYRNNDDNHITNIEIENFSLDYDPLTITYELGTVLYDVSTLDFTVQLADSNFAKYYINGVLGATSVPLSYGLNTITIQGESDFGTKGTPYIITVTRETPYTDVGLNDLTVSFDSNIKNFITFNPTTYVYTIDLNPQDSPVTVSITPELKNSLKQSITSSIDIDKPITIQNTTGQINQTIKFTVLAEDQAKQEYTIIIRKGNVASNDYSINDVIVTHTGSPNNQIEFDPTILEYNFTVGYSINQVNIDVNLNDANAKITYLKRPISLVKGSNIYEFYVTAENGDIGPTYKVVVTRNEPSSENELQELLINDPINSGAYLMGLDDKSPLVVFDGKQTYTITLSEAYLNQFITILHTKKEAVQEVTGDVNKQLILDAKTKIFQISVKPEDPNGIAKTYIINVEIKYEDNKLTNLKIDNQTLDLELPELMYTTLKDSVSIETTLENNFGKAVIKDNLGQTITGNNLSLEFGPNTYTLEIYNELGALVDTHTIEITREKHSDKDINSVLLLGDDTKNYLINFDEAQLIYNVEVPLQVHTVKLSANISLTAQFIGGGTFTIVVDETKTIKFHVVAENGDISDIYTINVAKRSLSTENELAEIHFRDPLDNTRFILGIANKDPLYIFVPALKEYTIELGLEYVGKQITVRYEKKDPYQIITGLSNGQAIELKRGTNVFKVTVEPEDIDNVDPLIYTVTILVKDKENSLESLKIDNQSVAFDPNEPTKFITENETAIIDFTSSSNDGEIVIKDSDGKIIQSPVDLNVGDNELTIEIYNEFGTLLETYELVIERQLSSNNEVIEALLTDAELKDYLSFNEDTLTYEITLPYEIDALTLNIEAFEKSNVYINDKHALNGIENFLLNSGQTQTVEFYVQAENSDLGSTYTILVTRSENTNNKLESLHIETNQSVLLNKDTFDSNTNKYTFEVDEQNKEVTFTVKTDHGQIVTGILFGAPLELKHGLNTFKLTVQAEDDSIQPFIITVEITVISSDVSLEKLLVNGTDVYRPNQTEFKLDDVTSDVTTLNIEAILTNTYGTVKINGVVVDQLEVDIISGDNIVLVELTSEDGKNSKTYTIKVTQLLDDVDFLDNLEVITNEGLYLLGDVLNNPTTVFDPLTNTYKFSVNEMVEEIFVDFILGSQKQTIEGPINTDLEIKHGVNTFEFKVTPEDKTLPSRVYTIEITRLFDEVIVNEFIVNGTDIYEENKFDYTVDSVTNDIKTIKVIPNFGNFATYIIKDTDNKVVNGNDVTLKFGVNTITVVVTSESGLVEVTYTVEIEQTYSSDNQIIDVRFFDASTNINRLNFDPEILVYDIQFPATTITARLRVETHNKALVYINSNQEINTRKDFTLHAGQTIEVKFYVIAEDGSTGEEYTINVYKRQATDPVLSDNTNLTDVTIEIPIDQVLFDFDPTIYEYTIQIPFGYEEIYIKAHTESLGAQVANEGAYGLIPGEPKVIRLRVTAEDGTVAEKEYKFTLVRALPNTDTTLESLVLKDINGNVLPFDQASFDPENRVYNISLSEDVRINKVNVEANKNHVTQTLYNTGIVNLHGEIEGYYNTIITITVVAQDGSIGEYVVYVLHELDFAGIAEVKDISVIGDDGISYFGLEFKSNVYQYSDVLVPFTVDTTRLIVQTIGNIVYLDSNLNTIEDNRVQAFEDRNQVIYRFRIESTNGQNKSEVYTITINRQQPDTNSLLEHLEINGELIKGFNPNVFEYNYVHPLQFENYVDIFGVAQSQIAKVRGNDIYTLVDGQTRTIHIEVTAESGDKTTYIIHVSYVNSNALLGELTVYEMIDGEEIENNIPLKNDTLDYVIIIGRDTRYVNIKGSAKDQGGASIKGFGIREVGTEDNIVEIIVTSGDGLEEITYTLTLRRDTSLSSLKEITLIQANDNEVLTNDASDPYVYYYKVTGGTNTVKLSAVSNNTSKVAINGGEFSTNNKGEIIITDVVANQVIRITVMAEDGSIEYYTVVLEKVQEPSMLLTILLILSIILWVITTMIYILKRFRKYNKKDKNQLIF